MQHYVTGRLEEQELEESVEDLLYHLIIFLFGPEQVLQHLNQIGFRNDPGNRFGSSDSGDKHHALENDVVLSEAVDEVVVDELEEVCPLYRFLPCVVLDVHHGAEEFEHEVGVVAALLHEEAVVLKVMDECFVAVGVELCYVTYTLEKEGVAVLAGSGN